MALVAFAEQYTGVSGEEQLLDNDGSAELVFVARSDASSADVQVAEVLGGIDNNTPSNYLGLPRATARYEEIGSGWYRLRIPYSVRQNERNRQTEPQSPGSISSFSFQFQGVTQHIRQSIKLVSKHDSAGTGLTVPGTVGKSEPINFDGDRVHGTDIIVPQASFAETHKFAVEDVDDDLKFTWMRMVGKTNEAKFRNAEIGELLLTKVAGTQRGQEDYDVTFEWLFRENETETFTIYPQGGGAGVDRSVSKKGFENIEFGYDQNVEANQRINKLIWVRVQQVYKSGDYGTLQLNG